MLPSATPSGPEASTSVCGAPFRSLHLDPSGHVRVCELNSLGMLGRIDSSTLRDLWTGARIGRIRTAVAGRDLSMGCEGCAPDALGDRRSITHAAYYDRFGPVAEANPQWPVQLELALSNRCNLECVMCNGDLSSKIRANREGLDPLPTVYADAFFAEFAEFAVHLQRVTFIGGEPFLAPEALRAFEILIETNPGVEVQVTTNGTVATPRVERILDALAVEISISMDGATAATYESIRIGAEFAQTLRNVEWFLDRAANLSLNYCLMTNNWHELISFARLADGFGVPLHINDVTSPPAFSLTHLGHDDLARIVESITAEQYDGPNRSVVEQQLIRLTAHLESGRTGSTPVLLSPPDRSGERRRLAGDLGTGRPELFERLRARVASTGPSTLDRPDPLSGLGVLSIVSERIIDAHPEHTRHSQRSGPGAATVAGLSLSDLVGRHLTELVGLLTAAHGELDGSTLAVHPNGEEERRLTFSTSTATTTVCALLVQAPHPRPGEPTSFWVLGMLTAGCATTEALPIGAGPNGSVATPAVSTAATEVTR